MTQRENPVQAPINVVLHLVKNVPRTFVPDKPSVLYLALQKFDALRRADVVELRPPERPTVNGRLQPCVRVPPNLIRLPVYDCGPPQLPLEPQVELYHDLHLVERYPDLMLRQAVLAPEQLIPQL